MLVQFTELYGSYHHSHSNNFVNRETAVECGVNLIDGFGYPNPNCLFMWCRYTNFTLYLHVYPSQPVYF